MNKPSRYWIYLEKVLKSPDKKGVFETENPSQLKRAISKRKDLADIPGKLSYRVEYIQGTSPMRWKLHVLLTGVTIQ